MDYLLITIIFFAHAGMSILTAALLSEPGYLNFELLLMKAFLISVLMSVPVWVIIFEGTRNAKRK